MRISRDVKDRKGIIGCSSIGKWLGVSRYGTPYDAYLEYMGMKPEPDTEAKERLEMGTALEEFIAKQAEKKYGVKMRRSQAYADPALPFLICHPDRLVSGSADGRRIAVEIKSSSAYDRRWGAIGSDEIPMDYLCQVMGYFICGVPCDEVWLVRFSNNTLSRYIVQRDEELMASIVKMLKGIWEKLRAGWKPDPSSYAEAVNIYTDITDDSVEASEDIHSAVERIDHIDEQIKELEEAKDSIKARVVSYLDGHSVLTYKGERLAKYSRVEQSRFDSRRFREDHPDMYEEYSAKSAYMKLTV